MKGASGGPHDFRLALFWAGIGAGSGLLVIPYVLALLPPEQVAAAPLPLPVIFLLQTVQLVVMFLLGGWAGLRLGRPLGLDSPFARAFVSGARPAVTAPRHFPLAAACGAIAGLAIVAMDKLVFAPAMERAGLAQPPQITWWKGLLASFYGGIAEELLVRLFLMTVIAWAAWRLIDRGRPVPSSAVYWTGNLLSTLLFSAGHLPAAAAIWPLTTLVIARIFILNSTAGLVFGVLFSKWGLEHAMLAHFTADLILHVVFAG